MRELIVVTYKLPADPLTRKIYGDDLENAYDCKAFWDNELAAPEIKKLQRKYDEVDSFVCNFAAYNDWVDNEAAWEEFVRTGVCPLKPMQEDVDVGTDSKTVTIQCNLRIEREDSTATFDYSVDIDDVGQIVFTPHDVGTRFCHSGEDVVEGENIKFETVTLTAQMLSDVDNYDYFMGTDEVGQFVITPEAEGTSFLSASVDDSLNLVTETLGSEDLHDPYDDEECPDWMESSFKIGDRVIVHLKHGGEESGKIVDYLSEDPMDSYLGCYSGEFSAWVVELDTGDRIMAGEGYLSPEITNESCEDKNMKFLKESDATKDWEWDHDELYAVIKADGRYAGVPCLSYEEAHDLSYHPGSKIFKLTLLPGQEDTEELEEEVTPFDRHKIVDRVMKGDLAVFSEEGTPDPAFIHLTELDTVSGPLVFEYYYDEESDSVVSYSRPNEG